MKAVILAGGRGTRLSEETHLRPKPMVEIGGYPLIWHIMKIYAHHGVTDFVIALGYKGYQIKEYFANYFLHSSNISIDLRTNELTVLDGKAEPWKVTLVDTGLDTNTGGRIMKLADHLGDEDFCLTYGDGLTDADLSSEIRQHRESPNDVTVLSVSPPGRYGILGVAGSMVVDFHEKPPGDGARVNGGFFVASTKVFERLTDEDQSWEFDVLPSIARDGSLGAYEHGGFWKAMDTLRDKEELEALWQAGSAPWMIW